jgi:hypothetical protein
MNEAEQLRELLRLWREDCLGGGFMPDEDGNKIAVTRTRRCADELESLLDAQRALRTVLRIKS